MEMKHHGDRRILEKDMFGVYGVLGLGHHVIVY
jgi:hypothetical protein